MTLPPFSSSRYSLRVRSYIGRLPPEVSDCLQHAFRDIRERRLGLDSPGGFRLPWVAEACHHEIWVSVNTDKNVVVVIDVIPMTGYGADPL